MEIGALLVAYAIATSLLSMIDDFLIDLSLWWFVRFISTIWLLVYLVHDKINAQVENTVPARTMYV
jgi:hypothetical protein